MSGPETQPEHPDDRDDGRPLNPGPADLGPEPPHAPSWAHDPEPDHDAGDEDEPAEDEDEDSEPETARPRPWAPLVARLRAIPLPKLSWPFGFPSLGSERHEMLPPLGRESAAPTAPVEPSPVEPARTTVIGRLTAWLPALSRIKRETRVGLAAVVTFVFLVTGMAANRGLLGKFHLLAMGSPKTVEGEPAKPGEPAPPDGKAKEPDKAKDKKDRPADPEKKPAGPSAALPAPNSAVSKDNGDKVSPDLRPSDYRPSAPGPEGEAARPTDPTRPSGPEPAPAGTDPAPTLPAPSSPPAPDEPLTLPSDKAEPPKGSPPIPDPMPPMPGETPAPGAAPAAPSVPGPDPSNALPSMLANDPPTPTTPAPTPSDPPPGPAPAPVPADPAPTPAPVVADAPPPSRATVPLPAERRPTLEQVPAPSPRPDPMAAATAEPGWTLIPSGGKRPPAGDSASGAGPGGLVVISEPLRVADGPAPADDPAAADQVEPVLHRVRSGENFFTISKLYYNSGRYYKALHAANRRQVPGIADLAVGDVIRVPPPEALDRSLILPPGQGAAANQPAADRAATTASRDSRPAEPADEVPVASSPRPRRTARPDPEARDEPVRPTYRVKAYDTLRSIARDTLNDSRRSGEILGLNRDSITDPSALTAGMTLTLPEDAIVGRRGR